MTYDVRVSYIEIYKEELRDLLDIENNKEIHIREDENQNTGLVDIFLNIYISVHCTYVMLMDDDILQDGFVFFVLFFFFLFFFVFLVQ